MKKNRRLNVGDIIMDRTHFIDRPYNKTSWSYGYITEIDNSIMGHSWAVAVMFIDGKRRSPLYFEDNPKYWRKAT